MKELDWGKIAAILALIALLAYVYREWRDFRRLAVGLVITLGTVAISGLLGVLWADDVGMAIVYMCSNGQSLGNLAKIGTEFGLSLVNQPIRFGYIGGGVGVVIGLWLGSRAASYVDDPYWYMRQRALRREKKEKMRRESAMRLSASGPARMAADAWWTLARDTRLSPEIRIEAAQVLERMVEAGHGERQYDFVVSARVNEVVEKAANQLGQRVRIFSKFLIRYERSRKLGTAAHRARFDVASDYGASTSLRLDAARGLPESECVKATIGAWRDQANSAEAPSIRMQAIQQLIELHQDRAARTALARIARDKAVESDARLEAIETLQQLGADKLAARILLDLWREGR